MVDHPIHPGKGQNGVYSHLKKAIDYILKPEKTEGGLYTGSQNCLLHSALQEMIHTKKQYGKEPRSDNDRLGYHFVISWSPREHVDPQTALEITEKFCREYLGDYEAVYSAHLDTAHMHTHIICNSVNYKTGKKFRYRKNDWERIQQPLLDRLCKEYGLHALEEDTGVKPGKHDKASVPGDIRKKIDHLIPECRDFLEFEQKLRQAGYEIKYGSSEKYGEYMALRNDEMKRFKRTQTLGAGYTLEMLKSRIAAYHNPLPEDPQEQEKMICIVGAVCHCRIRYGTDNIYLRKQYARMYRLGMIAGYGKHVSYKETAKRVKQLRRLEYQLGLLAERDYRKPEDIDMDIAACEEELKSLEMEYRQRRMEEKPYIEMLAVYKNMEELEGAFLLWKEGDVSFQTEAEQYVRLREQAQAFPYTKDELEHDIRSHAQKKREAGRDLSGARQKQRALKELKAEYAQVMKTYEPATDEMLAVMEEPDDGAKQIRKKERKNK